LISPLFSDGYGVLGLEKAFLLEFLGMAVSIYAV
jgi:hypothetical protein